MTRPVARDEGARDDVVTADGHLVRLVVDEDGDVIGAVAIETPLPWVLRKAVLTVDDVA